MTTERLSLVVLGMALCIACALWPVSAGAQGPVPEDAPGEPAPEVQPQPEAPPLPPVQAVPALESPPAPDPTPEDAPPVVSTETGVVSFYGREFAGRRTANGEIFNPGALTMAHRTLPFGTLVRVTNLFNNKSVTLRVNDRGPFVGGRIGDLSAGAAALLDMVWSGVVRAKLEILGMGERVLGRR